MTDTHFPPHDTPFDSGDDRQRQSAAGLGKVPHPSEPFGTVPKSSEGFRNVRQTAERTDQHTSTVREVVRLFEDRGVPRSERSIVNWCQPNRHGAAHLDAYYDGNERRYYITPESVERVIQEELAKQAKAIRDRSASVGDGQVRAREVPVPTAKEKVAGESSPTRKESGDSPQLEDLEKQNAELKLQNRDLEITNRTKDMFIEAMKKDRQEMIVHLIAESHKVGELRTQLLQLESAESPLGRKLTVRSLSDATVDHAQEPMPSEVV